MKIKTAIQKAIEGGWVFDEKFECTVEELLNNYDDSLVAVILLEKGFWQALGKSEGWSENTNIEIDSNHFFVGKFCAEGVLTRDLALVDASIWSFKMLEFMDYIAQGQDIETAFDNATK